MRALALLIAAGLLAGCETAYKDGVPDERSPWFFVPAGSKLVLHRSIQAEPGATKAYLQDGKLRPWYDVNQYGPYCAISVGSRRLEPDVFVVRSFSHHPLFTLAAAPAGGLQRVDRKSSDSDGMTYEVLAAAMDIHSERQPEARGMTCASWCLPQGRMCLTVADIRRSLGSYFTLELPASGKP
jgi:hypothetical protein